MAQEQAQENLYDYLYSKYLMKELTGITMTNDDFVEKSYLAFRGIGNIATAIHAFEAVIGQNIKDIDDPYYTNRVYLPVNCEFVESVSTGNILKDEYDDFIVFYGTDDLSNASITVTTGSFLPDVMEDARYRRHNLSRSELHPKGELIPYKIGGSGCQKYLEFEFDTCLFSRFHLINSMQKVCSAIHKE